MNRPVAGGLRPGPRDPAAADRRLGFLDLLWAALLVLFVLWYRSRFVSFSHYPEEDAAMLLRYSERVAQGHGVVWNVGERPVDGTTDFLFMIIVGCPSCGQDSPSWCVIPLLDNFDRERMTRRTGADRVEL